MTDILLKYSIPSIFKHQKIYAKKTINGLQLYTKTFDLKSNIY